MSDRAAQWDVLVVGGGNAGLCAAITARQAGARVLVAEHAPRHFRGGNSRHTRNLRIMHREPTNVLSESYPEDEFWNDMSLETMKKAWGREDYIWNKIYEKEKR